MLRDIIEMFSYAFTQAFSLCVIAIAMAKGSMAYGISPMLSIIAFPIVLGISYLAVNKGFEIALELLKDLSSRSYSLNQVSSLNLDKPIPVKVRK